MLCGKTTTLMKTIKEDLNKCKGMPCSWFGRLVVKMSIFPRLIYRFNPNQNSSIFFFLDIDKLILKFIRKGKKIRIAKTISKKNKFGRFALLDFKTYYKALVNKAMWY